MFKELKQCLQKISHKLQLVYHYYDENLYLFSVDLYILLIVITQHNVSLYIIYVKWSCCHGNDEFDKISCNKNWNLSEFLNRIFSWGFFTICVYVHVIILDNFCSFFSLISAYKLIHSDTCLCSKSSASIYLRYPLLLPLPQIIPQLGQSMMILSSHTPLYLTDLPSKLTPSYCLKWWKVY